MARIWQTPAAGEALMEHALTTPADHPESTATALRGWGVPAEHALAMNGRLDRTMCDAILSLYRSATPNVFADWGATTGTPKSPGLVLIPEQDHVEIAELSEQTAELLGARHVGLPDLGHWWMLQDPEHSAWELTTFWDSLR